MKAANCDECKHGSSPDALQPKFVCKKGHKPRFYTSRKDVFDCGWKRRCDEFAIRVRGET